MRLISLFNKSGLTSVGGSVTAYGSLQPVPLASSMCALAIGLSAFLLRKQIGKFFAAHSSASKIVGLINGGYGFDRLCSVLSRLTFSSAFTLSRKQYFDRPYSALGRLTLSTALSLSKKRFFDRFYGITGRLIVALASGVRKIQTGILGWNIVMMMVGVMGVILLTMLWG